MKERARGMDQARPETRREAGRKMTPVREVLERAQTERAADWLWRDRWAD